MSKAHRPVKVNVTLVQTFGAFLVIYTMLWLIREIVFVLH